MADAGSKRRASVLPLEALNPYTSSWTIRVRACGKGALRTVKTVRGESKVFSIELTDEQGVTIQATAWREAADTLHAAFEDGKAYYVSNGQLRPANKQYASSSFAYELTLNETTRVELCTDTEMVVTNTHFEFVPLDQLAQRLGSKALLDVLGVVTHVGEMGAVVRKKDNMELKKREITLLDSTARTVKLTLWDEVAEKTGAELAALTAPIVAFKAVRLGDYNGVSLSTLNKSTCVLEPAVEAATRLRAWYSTVGATVQTVEAGAGLVGSGGGGGAGGAGRATRKSLSELVDAPLLSPDAKPEWATLHGCVVHIQPDSSLYYCACPEEGCNKKVVQDGGGWLCEATGHRFPECKRRYILRFKAADATCAAWVNAFDDQGRQMFGCSADELHAEKEGDNAAFLRRLKEATWKPWIMKTKSTTDSYNGELRRRITATSLAKPDFAAQCQEMLALIAAS